MPLAWSASRRPGESSRGHTTSGSGSPVVRVRRAVSGADAAPRPASGGIMGPPRLPPPTGPPPPLPVLTEPMTDAECALLLSSAEDPPADAPPSAFSEALRERWEPHASLPERDPRSRRLDGPDVHRSTADAHRAGTCCCVHERRAYAIAIRRLRAELAQAKSPLDDDDDDDDDHHHHRRRDRGANTNANTKRTTTTTTTSDSISADEEARRLVGRLRRIRLRSEFRTWWGLASRSRAIAASLAAFAARRRVRVLRVVLAAFTRVVEDSRRFVSANRRADRCARRSTWRRAVPLAFAAWRSATPSRGGGDDAPANRVEDERDARVAAESALDAFRESVATRLARKKYLRRGFRAWTRRRDVLVHARASIRVSAADARADRRLVAAAASAWTRRAVSTRRAAIDDAAANLERTRRDVEARERDVEATVASLVATRIDAADRAAAAARADADEARRRSTIRVDAALARAADAENAARRFAEEAAAARDAVRRAEDGARREATDDAERRRVVETSDAAAEIAWLRRATATAWDEVRRARRDAGRPDADETLAAHLAAVAGAAWAPRLANGATIAVDERTFAAGGPTRASRRFARLAWRAPSPADPSPIVATDGDGDGDHARDRDGDGSVRRRRRARDGAWGDRGPATRAKSSPWTPASLEVSTRTRETGVGRPRPERTVAIGTTTTSSGGRRARRRAEEAAWTTATLAFRATKLLAEDAEGGASVAVDDRRGPGDLANAADGGPPAYTVETPGEMAAEKIKTAADGTRRGSPADRRRAAAAASVRLALPGDSSDSDAGDDAGDAGGGATRAGRKRATASGGGGSPRAPMDVDGSGGSDSDGVDSLADEVFGALAPPPTTRRKTSGDSETSGASGTRAGAESSDDDDWLFERKGR